MIFYYVAITKLFYQFVWLLFIPIYFYLIAIIIKRVAIDTIETYNRWQTAKADITKRQLVDQFIEDSRRAKLTIWQRQARAQITQQRTALQLGSEAMWKMGIFDIEIDEARNDTVSA